MIIIEINHRCIFYIKIFIGKGTSRYSNYRVLFFTSSPHSILFWKSGYHYIQRVSLCWNHCRIVIVQVKILTPPSKDNIGSSRLLTLGRTNEDREVYKRKYIMNIEITALQNRTPPIVFCLHSISRRPNVANDEWGKGNGRDTCIIKMFWVGKEEEIWKGEDAHGWSASKHVPGQNIDVERMLEDASKYTEVALGELCRWNVTTGCLNKTYILMICMSLQRT